MLKIEPLKNSVSHLEEALVEYEVNPSEFMRDACILRFEQTYDLSCKTIKLFLREISARHYEINGLDFKPLIREALAAGLVSDFNKWVLYRGRRSRAGNSYGIKIAEEAFAVIPDFLEEVRFVLKQLSELLENDGLYLSAT